MEAMEKQEALRAKLYALLGDLPKRGDHQIASSVVGRDEAQGYSLEKLVLDLNGEETVPAYFIKPKNHNGKLPVILYNHAHGGDYHKGKDELFTGAAYITRPYYGEALTKEGYAVLCIDAWAFGERRGRTETQCFKHMLWYGRSMWGMMLYDSMRALDYLETRDDVDMGRVGTMGISMGGTHSWWLSALDTRIKVCIDMCSMTDYESLIEINGLDSHNVYYYVPGLLKHFTTAEINALIAPRPHLSMNGTYDKLTPAMGFDKINRILAEVYHEWGKEDAWLMQNEARGHYETSQMKASALSFLKKWL